MTNEDAWHRINRKSERSTDMREREAKQKKMKGIDDLGMYTKKGEKCSPNSLFLDPPPDPS